MIISGSLTKKKKRELEPFGIEEGRIMVVEIVQDGDTVPISFS
jgi:hypothetical protein